MDLEILK